MEKRSKKYILKLDEDVVKKSAPLTTGEAVTISLLRDILATLEEIRDGE